MSNQSQTGWARCQGRICAVGLAAMFTVACAPRVAVAQDVNAPPTSDARAPFFDPSVLDPSIPSPLSVVGFEVGRQAVRYDALVRYLHALADASPAVTLTPYAESHEDRTLYYLTITSPANHARLARIKEANARLADPRRGSTAELNAAIVEGSIPAVAWLAYCIHGDELSSTDAAMQVAYRVAAGTDDEMRRLRDELVIHIDPLMNPDGRERYLGQIEQLSGKVANPDYQAMQHRGLWSAGRGNHYLFDLNRDWLMQVHPETKGRAAAILSWNPHLVVDSHEMGELDTYLFDPPREPLNVQLSAKVMAWRRRFSADQAAAFDRHGWSYYTREWYEEWYAGYTNSWASVTGAVGLLYEQAAVNAASIKQANGRTLTYREAVHHQVVSSLANLETLRANRLRILQDYAADRRRAVSGEEANGGVFLLPPPPDRSKLLRFVDLLRAQGIEVSVASAAFDAHRVVDIWGTTQETKSFRSGTLVVGSLQPHRRLLHSILEFDPRMSDGFLADERLELENRRPSKLYDVTAWNLPMAYGLEAFWANRVGGLDTIPFAPPSNKGASYTGDIASYGYLIDGADSTIHRAIVRLFDAGCQPRVGTELFVIADRAYQPGAVLLRRHENPDDLPRILRDIEADSGVRIYATDTALSTEGPDLGGQKFPLLQRPRVAIASQWPVSTTSFGNVWYALDDRLALRSSPINVQNLRTVDLRKYNVLVLPDVSSGQTLGRVLDEKGVANLKSWIESGGTLIAMGRAAAFLADKDRGLSSVRLKRHVLGELSVYAESVEREKSARNASIDPAVVWGRSAATGRAATGDTLQGKEPDIEALKRDDEWNRLFKPNGAIVAGALASDHWLCFGLGDRLPLLVSGEFAYMSRHPVVTPVRLMDEGHLRLSGLMWPEARARWADTAYATVESVGRGQIILFANDPFFRGYFEGSLRLMLNAIVLGPGMGTSPPLPW